MGKHDRLIAFLEQEIEALRHRIEGLAQRTPPRGTPPGWADPGQGLTDAEARARLRELEGHLRELRAEDEPRWRPRIPGEAE